MKIGVMTWFHYLNYGTALQLTALCHTLKNMGHSVKVINYKPNITVSRLENGSILKEYFDKIPNKIKNRGLKHYTSEGKENLFYDFYNQLSFTDEVITLSDFQELNDKFDFFVCGSDQIWSPLNFNPRYFLDFVTDKNKMIAYAP
ncbi:polysaccharide pyruvyl transferase family protein, partial [Clostridium perfringens]